MKAHGTVVKKAPKNAQCRGSMMMVDRKYDHTSAPTAIPKRRPRGATRDDGGTPRDNSARLAAKLRSAHL